jgi:large subunit ribosomal protein L10
MNREEKTAAIAELKEVLLNTPFFYLADSSKLPVSKINQLRRQCFQKGISMQVAKNTLIQKALEDQPDSKGYKQLFEALAGPTTILISDNPKAPAILISAFRGKDARPILKAAYIDGGVFLGDDQLDILKNIKSKEELVGEVIGLLQSPIQRLLGQLKTGGNTIAGLVKALEERG